jgi:hypothetical protein
LSSLYHKKLKELIAIGYFFSELYAIAITNSIHHQKVKINGIKTISQFSTELNMQIIDTPRTYVNRRACSYDTPICNRKNKYDLSAIPSCA